MTDRMVRSGYRFGTFELQPGARRLLADGKPVALGQRAFDLLGVLLERAGQLVTNASARDNLRNSNFESKDTCARLLCFGASVRGQRELLRSVGRIMRAAG